MAIYRETLLHSIGNAEEMVLLTVKTGDLQHLAQCMLHTPSGSYHTGPFHGFCIGKGSALKGKESNLTIMVTDTNPMTNNTSVVVSLTNNQVTEAYSESSDIDNGTVIYIITIQHR